MDLTDTERLETWDAIPFDRQFEMYSRLWNRRKYLGYNTSETESGPNLLDYTIHPVNRGTCVRGPDGNWYEVQPIQPIQPIQQVNQPTQPVQPVQPVQPANQLSQLPSKRTRGCRGSRTKKKTAGPVDQSVRQLVVWFVRQLVSQVTYQPVNHQPVSQVTCQPVNQVACQSVSQATRPCIGIG